MENYGILSVLPMITLFIFVFATKRVILSIIAATIMGIFVIGDGNPMLSWLDYIQRGGLNGTTVWLNLLIALFGILIMLFEKSGAVTEFAQFLSKYATTRKKALLITYVLGLLIFVDDYLNNLAIATAMKKLTDKFKVPRTLLGYIINSTAAPVCIILPISTWAVFYGTLFESNGVTYNGSGMGAYIHAIPYMFYGWIVPIVVLLVILGVIPLMGITKKHNQLALETGIVIPAGVGFDNDEPYKPDGFEESDEELKKAKPWNFLIPMIVLVVVTAIFDLDVMPGCIGAIIAASVLYLAERKISFKELCDATYEGVESMKFVYLQTICIMTLVEINTTTGLSDYIVSVTSPILSGVYLPVLVFVVLGIYSYFGGGFWDMAMIFMPVVIPLANMLHVDPILTGAALISATAFGSNTYVCGDGVVVASRANDIKPPYQMLGTLPYALISAGISAILFFVVGLVTS